MSCCERRDDQRLVFAFGSLDEVNICGSSIYMMERGTIASEIGLLGRSY